MKQLPKKIRAGDKTKSYEKSYKMQTVGPAGETVRTSVPRAVVEKEARERGMEVNEFVKKFKISWLYDGFEGMWGVFVPTEEEIVNT